MLAEKRAENCRGPAQSRGSRSFVTHASCHAYYAASVSPQSPDAIIGRTIDGRYLVRSLIARGGMATVFVATDTRLDRRVAIKIMHEHLAADATFRTKFIHEARAAARLAHPNLVNVYDQGEDGSLAYIVMEYVPGITLRDLLHDHHRLTVEQTIDIMDAVLAGLQVAHKQGIIHRDIKPENVLLADDGRIKLSDFGLARAVTNATASGSVLLGTIAYLAPELVTHGNADVRSDVYSAGIMMYEMLVGEQPYRGEEPVNIAYRHANDQVPPPSQANPNVPTALDDLVVWATERNPEDRPADAGAMLAALRQAEQALDVSLAPTAPFAVANSQYDEPESQLLATTHNTDPVEPGAKVRRLERLNRQKRRAGAVAAFVVALAVLAAAAFGWYEGLGPGSYNTVPNVVTRAQGEAETLLTQNGFVVGEVTPENSLEVPEGTVMSMDPPADTSLAPDSPVNLVVSAGPRILTVPALDGLEQDAAVAAIGQAGFVFDATDPVAEFSAEAPAGQVLRATGVDGKPLPQKLPERAKIRIVTSLGPVPDITGQGVTLAEDALAKVGLKTAVVSREFSSTVPEGVVLRQENTADPMKPGSTVNVAVSKGPDLVEVPKVTGQSAKDAIAALEGAGFRVQHSIPDILLPTAKVSAQDPAGGAAVERGATVTLRATYEF